MDGNLSMCIIIVMSISYYAVRSMWNSYQDRKTEEAQARVKVAELELKKQRESPKFPAYVPEDALYEQGLTPLIQERE